MARFSQKRRSRTSYRPRDNWPARRPAKAKPRFAPGRGAVSNAQTAGHDHAFELRGHHADTPCPESVCRTSPPAGEGSGVREVALERFECNSRMARTNPSIFSPGGRERTERSKPYQSTVAKPTGVVHKSDAAAARRAARTLGQAWPGMNGKPRSVKSDVRFRDKYRGCWCRTIAQRPAAVRCPPPPPPQAVRHHGAIVVSASAAMPSPSKPPHR